MHLSSAASKNRIQWIDVAKGIAILMVVLGHSFQDGMRAANPLFDFLYRCFYIFHMSFFFWLSGYVYGMKRERIVGKKPFLMKKVQKQLVPWLLYGMLIYAAFWCACTIGPLKSILNNAGYGRIGLGTYLVRCLLADNPYAYHLWFIYVLFLLSSLVYLIDRYSRKAEPVFVILYAGCMAGLLLIRLFMGHEVSGFRLLNYLFLYIPFYLTGIFMSRRSIGVRVQTIWGGIGLVYIVIRAIFFSGFNGNNIQAPNLALQMLILYLGHLLLPGCMLLLCRGSAAIAESGKGGWLQALGERSFLIYLFHQPFCCGFVGALLYGKLHAPALAVIVLCFCLSLTVPLAVGKLLKVFEIAWERRSFRWKN